MQRVNLARREIGGGQIEFGVAYGACLAQRIALRIQQPQIIALHIAVGRPAHGVVAFVQRDYAAIGGAAGNRYVQIIDPADGFGGRLRRRFGGGFGRDQRNHELHVLPYDIRVRAVHRQRADLQRVNLARR